MLQRRFRHRLFLLPDSVSVLSWNLLSLKRVLGNYPIPPHKQNSYKEWNNESYEISEKIHNEALSLAISGVQSFEDTIKITNLIDNFNK